MLVSKEKVRKILLVKEMTQSELARKLHMTRQAVSDILKWDGMNNRPETLERYARALNVNIEDIAMKGRETDTSERRKKRKEKRDEEKRRHINRKLMAWEKNVERNVPPGWFINAMKRAYPSFKKVGLGKARKRKIKRYVLPREFFRSMGFALDHWGKDKDDNFISEPYPIAINGKTLKYLLYLCNRLGLVLTISNATYWGEETIQIKISRENKEDYCER